MTSSFLIRTLEIAAVVQSWFVAGWLFRHVNVQQHHSISYHGGTGPGTYPIFGLSLSAHAITFIAFTFLWVMPALRPGPAFAIVASLAATMQLLTAWIRDGDNPVLHRWHGIVAYIMAYTMPVMLGLLLAQAHLSLVPTITSTLALITMVVLILLTRVIKSTHTHYLWYQSTYILSFQLAIISIAIAG